jgi:hypothetical protein
MAHAWIASYHVLPRATINTRVSVAVGKMHRGGSTFPSVLYRSVELYSASGQKKFQWHGAVPVKDQPRNSPPARTSCRRRARTSPAAPATPAPAPPCRRPSALPCSPAHPCPKFSIVTTHNAMVQSLSAISPHDRGLTCFAP